MNVGSLEYGSDCRRNGVKKAREGIRGCDTTINGYAKRLLHVVIKVDVPCARMREVRKLTCLRKSVVGWCVNRQRLPSFACCKWQFLSEGPTSAYLLRSYV
jgi:hypothetical protein